MLELATAMRERRIARRVLNIGGGDVDTSTLDEDGKLAGRLMA